MSSSCVCLSLSTLNGLRENGKGTIFCDMSHAHRGIVTQGNKQTRNLVSVFWLAQAQNPGSAGTFPRFPVSLQPCFQVSLHTRDIPYYLQ